MIDNNKPWSDTYNPNDDGFNMILPDYMCSVDRDFWTSEKHKALSHNHGPIEEYELNFYMKRIIPQKTAKNLIIPTIIVATVTTLAVCAIIWACS